ncbi:transglutaminase-like domain-containing protein [Paenibacillus sp. GXUN7292]|uniref:transglutaminase-like domain-containing protein n=1 Tax=Paenibacillus sp. GXUN7292 TaxID=3422499 RepID=UPI003D7CF0E3
MISPKDSEGSLLYRLFTSAFLFGLLMEWIYPWTSKFTGTGQQTAAVLYVFLGVVVAIGLLRLSAWFELLLQGINCLMTLALLFKEERSSMISWLLQMPGLLVDHIASLFESGLLAMSGELRTLLLLIGFAMLIPALQRLIWLRQIGLVLVGLTMLYLIVLHVALGYNTFYGLVRAAAAGMLLVSIAALPRIDRLLDTEITAGLSAGLPQQTPKVRLSHDQQIRDQFKKWNIRAICLAAAICSCVLLVSAPMAQKHEPPQWTAALSEQFTHMLESSAKPKAAKASTVSLDVQTGKALSGYSFDDSLLGAPFQDDDMIMFYGTTPVEGYWRGEAKSYYDGKGWSFGVDRELAQLFQPIEARQRDSGNKPGGKAVEEKASAQASQAGRGALISQTIVFAKPQAAMPFFSTGYQSKLTQLIAADPRRKLHAYIQNESTSGLYPVDDYVQIEQYTIDSYLPIVDEKQLRRLEQELKDKSDMTQETSSSVREELTPRQLAPYLQLNDSIPDRVLALSAEIAGGGVTSRYDQVKAVEAYLKTSYSYTKENSSIPPEGSDFVDHFLFEQQSGYCVHFSTAMVVMLRAQDIPARWVKGFASGEKLAADEKYTAATGTGSSVRNAVYEVRSSDAHAWVEVYFPGAGWVPFDPTPGYSGQAELSNYTGTEHALSQSGLNSGSSTSSANSSNGGSSVFEGSWLQQANTQIEQTAKAFAQSVKDTYLGLQQQLESQMEKWGIMTDNGASVKYIMLGAVSAAVLLFAAVFVAIYRLRFRIKAKLHLLTYARMYKLHKAAFESNLPSRTERKKHGQISGAKRIKLDVRLRDLYLSLMDCIWHSLLSNYPGNSDADTTAGTVRRAKSDEENSKKATVSSASDKQSNAKEIKSNSFNNRLSSSGQTIVKPTLQLIMTWREKKQQIMPYLCDEQRMELDKLLVWSEEASFQKANPWLSAPSPDELRNAIKLVLRRQLFVRLGKRNQLPKIY